MVEWKNTWTSQYLAAPPQFGDSSTSRLLGARARARRSAQLHYCTYLCVAYITIPTVRYDTVDIRTSYSYENEYVRLRMNQSIIHQLSTVGRYGEVLAATQHSSSDVICFPFSFCDCSQQATTYCTYSLLALSYRLLGYRHHDLQ